jgi:small GTP-binding protein
MASYEEQIKAIEEEIRKTPYNKATQHHIGRLKAKIARLKEEAEKRAQASGGPKAGYSIKKGGDATVVLVGFPSVGKSTLLNQLTNAESEVGSYDFTTLKVIPGMMEHKGAMIQVLDVPGIVHGAASGKGRGREVIGVMRSADLVLFVIDVFNLKQYDVLKTELYNAGLRLDTRPKDIKIKKKARGGLTISSTVELKAIDEKTVKAILHEYRIHNADVVFREDATPDDFLDVITGNRIYVPSVIALNKVDLVKEDYLAQVKEQLPPEFIPISAHRGTNLERLKEVIFEKLDFIRVYMKPQGEKADLEEPMVVMRGSTVGDICDRLHRDFRRNFRYARVWGDSVKFAGQRAGMGHVLMDGDIVSIVIKK